MRISRDSSGKHPDPVGPGLDPYLSKNEERERDKSAEQRLRDRLREELRQEFEEGFNLMKENGSWATYTIGSGGEQLDIDIDPANYIHIAYIDESGSVRYILGQ